MKTKVIFLVTSCVMVFLLLLASCGQQTATTTPTTKPSTTSVTTSTTPTTVLTTKPTTTSAGTTPQYGGTFAYRDTRDPSDWDPFYAGVGGYSIGQRLWYETVVMADLTTDPKIFDYTGSFHPWEYNTGRLVESWESSDPVTWILHVRQGVKWQDISPLNGREFTAYDIEYNFHRLFGLGSGFTKASSYIGMDNFANIKAITAIDKYTVEVKLKIADLETMRFLFEGRYTGIIAREPVEKWGNVNDWRHTIGTGPFIMKDYVSGSSLTAIRNPNYWGYDKLYPKNQLPYLDEIRVLIIPDDATAYAALRTGKIDMVLAVDWRQSVNFDRTNPELQKQAWAANGWSILLHVDTKPFDDIRVRKAMQMSLDLPTIAQTYYGGTISSAIYGAYAMPGYYTPFEQWPQEVKDGFTYNPAGAKKLLADAGYPSGFKFTLTAGANHDLDLYQVIQSYFEDVGITMDIQVMDNVAFSAYTTGDKHVAMSFSLTSNVNYPPMVWINQYTSRHYTYRGHLKDATYDKMWDEVKAIIDVEQQKKQIIKMNDYATAQFYRVTTQPYNSFVLWQPWLKGYRGTQTNDGILGAPTRTMWIDKSLKK